MRALVLDFETYFDNDYTLKKLTTEAYVRDERFEVHGVGLRWADEPTSRWHDAENALAELHDIDWPRTAVLAHHAHFDGLILSHIYGIYPAMWLCTFSMGRVVHGNALSVGLGSLAKHYGLEDKSVPYEAFRGKRWDELDHDVQRQLATGCLHDIDLTLDIFNRMRPLLPTREFALIDMTVRMFTEPMLVGDAAAFEQIAMDEEAEKNELLDELGVGIAELRSREKFVALLEAEDVDIVYKEGKNRQIPAVAKNDLFMHSLVERNDYVGKLARARVRCSSSIDESRARRLAYMAQRGALCVYLSYAAAQTFRWGGGDKVNLQNLRRGGRIRQAIRAPDGCELALVDSAQGEARLAAYVARQDDLVETFRAGKDPYVDVASEFYHKAITKEMKPERGLGKLLVLSCSYGSGAKTIQSTARAGTYGPPLMLSIEAATEAKRIYRERNPHIVKAWERCGHLLSFMSQAGEGETMKWGGPGGDLFTFGRGYVESPGGLRMLYKLRWFQGEKSKRPEWHRQTRDGLVRIWGGTLFENLIQHLHRVFIGEVLYDLAETGYRVVWTTHDDVTVLLRKSRNNKTHLNKIIARMARSPVWAPDLPMDAEGVLSEAYK